MKLFKITGFWSAARAIVAWPLLIFGLYMASAWIGSSIPANGDWHPAAEGIDIFVETNGVHVSLVVPISAGGEDLSDLIRPDDLSDPALYGTHAMIGWGHAGVYRNTATWTQLRIADAASAIFGSEESLLHVYHLIRPLPTIYRKRIRVSNSEFRSIIKQIRATFELNAKRRSIAHPAYGANNLFYEAHGRYDAITTCNEWTGRVLRNAGIRVGRWTPMPGGVMRWF